MSYLRQALLLILFVSSGSVHANCQGTFINPITSVNWSCMFPMNLGGVMSLGGKSDRGASDINVGSPICSCLNQGGKTIVGLNVGFWEPARIIETVKDPYCFPTIGTSMGSPVPGSQSGSSSKKYGSFSQAHYYIFPLWAMLKMFKDVPCLAGNKVEGTGKDFDLAMITEVLPTWNNDLMGFLINPETILFANPAAVASCMADSAAVATRGRPLNALFWCMGGWPGTYPVTGHVQTNKVLLASTTSAGRALYMLARKGVVMDHGINACGSVRTWIWRKENYRWHFAQPVRSASCNYFGTPSLLWETAKNPPINGDNFSYILFRKMRCCIGY